MSSIFDILLKYNISVPRYTSYPPVPMWHSMPSVEDWINNLKQNFEKIQQQGISIYIHLPFCEQLCTYCGCNKRITKNHQVEDPYIDSVLKEWKFYQDIFGKINIREIHLGGGTPTFFSPKNLEQLISGLFKDNTVANDFQGSVEIHPHFSKLEHLDVLRALYFDRISIGVQDFDKKVQIAINRTQEYSEVKRLTEYARKLGYKSVNYDLVYGLPFQSREGLSDTIQKVIELKPDRIAFYSYAHVPWIKASQRKFTEKDLPTTEEKIQLYLMGREMFMNNGYEDVGMDHFALPEDELFMARRNKTLHRNFMGYTVQHTDTLIALGVSSISDSGDMYVQNSKEVEEYQTLVQKQIPVLKGHKVSDDEKKMRKHLLNLLCYFETTLEDEQDILVSMMKDNPMWDDVVKNNLAVIENNKIKATDLGKLLIRNVCYALDKPSQKAHSEKPLFSKAI
ncbi:MAG TPA: oxygen-independent coproporphyrinogen III oxidase [Bacteroidia bacterium]|nr:oxygen-independent coproporphyrinogen III oxidase [Bacteroidia bacterium]